MGEAENQAEPEYEITKGIQYKGGLSAFIILFIIHKNTSLFL